MRMGDGRGPEGKWRSRKERWVCDERKRRGRSSSREDLVSSTSRNDLMDTKDNRVFISWDKFVTKSFLHAHFSRFGEVEFIWMDGGGAFFGFVTFVRDEVGRSLVGACHNVEGVEILIKRAKPDWRRQERRREVKTCAFFKEGRCLRHGHCQFLHTVEPRTSSRRSSRSGSREKARRREVSSVDQRPQELRARRDRDERSKLKEYRKSPLLKEVSSERDGRLRPPPSGSKDVKVREKLLLPTSSRSDEVRRGREISKEKVGSVEVNPREGSKRESVENEQKRKSCSENKDPKALKESGSWRRP